jgi:hypothetical protein
MTFTEIQSAHRTPDGEFDLDPELVLQFARRPVLVAESIVTDDNDELVRRPVDEPAWHSLQAGIPAESVRTGDIEDDIEDYIGTTVRTESEVDKQISRSIFTVDDDIVVVAERLNQAVTPDMDVTVIGTVVRFDRDAIEQELPGYSVDLLPDAERDLIGRPVIIARSVRTEAGVELMAPPTMSRR